MASQSYSKEKLSDLFNTKYEIPETSTHGAKDPEGESEFVWLFKYLRDLMVSSRPIAEFFCLTTKNLTEGIQGIRNAISENIEFFAGNYLLFVLGCLLMYVMFNPILAFVAALWIVTLSFVKKHDKKIEIAGISFPKRLGYVGTLLATVVFLGIFHQVTLGLFFVSCLIMLSIFSHAAFVQNSLHGTRENSEINY